MLRQQSPWEIGSAYYDQRDLYTLDGRIDAAGYAIGPSFHPEEGSYAYPRELRGEPPRVRTKVDLPVREAWPILNYVGPDEDPYFAFLRDRHARHGLWGRLADAAKHMKERLTAEDPWKAADKRIRREVDLALAAPAELDATDIEVTVHWAVVTLNGTVPDARSRWIAGEIAGDVRQVRGVQNRLAVRDDDSSDGRPVFVLPIAAL